MTVERITEWIREHVARSGARGLVVGLSGGVDSSVVARLCQLAMPETTLGVLLSCYSDPRDEADARLVADHFDLPTVRVGLESVYDGLVRTLQNALVRLPWETVPEPPPDDLRGRVPLANIKPRLRMTCLYFVANRLNYLVAGTGNRSELAIGYFTKHGDGGVDLLPVGGYLKREVRALAVQLGVPGSIIQKPPSAGLWPGQIDETEMGFTYADLEAYLERGPEVVAPAIALRIERLVRHSSHKRSMPPIAEPSD